MSIRESILSAMVVMLSSLCGGRIYRSRKEQLPTLPAIVIRPESESDDGETLGSRDINLIVAVDIYARGDIPDQAADSVLESALSLIDSDATLGMGSDVQIMPTRQIEWSIDNYDDVSATLRLQIFYRKFS